MIDRSLNYGRKLVKSFLISSKPFKNVLDIGAGKGNDLFIAQEVEPKCKMHALEYYPPNVELLRKNDVKVHSINIEQDIFPYNNGIFDVVIANQILEHTKELFWIFHEVTRVLKVGGYFIIGVPNLASLHNRLLLLMGRQPTPINSASAHIRGFTKSDIVNFIDSCWQGGYQLIERKGSNFYPFPPIIARPLASLLPSMSWGLFLLFEKQEKYNDEFIKFPIVNNLETNFVT